MRISIALVLLRAASGGLVLLAPIAAQCTTVFGPLGSGVVGDVWALATRPNGDVVACVPTLAQVARWNGTSWSTLYWPGSSSGTVYSLATLPNGDVVAGGSFSGLTLWPPTVGVARWNGVTWSALGDLGPYLAFNLTSLQNGDVVAAGFTVPMRWNGVTWSQLGPGLSIVNGAISSLLTMSNGDVIAGGLLTVAGIGPQVGVARWNGVSWTAVGPGQFSGTVTDIAVLPDGGLVAAFTDVTTYGHVVRWDGATWHHVAAVSGMNGPINALAVLPNGDVIASGPFTTADGAPANGIARWNGSAWSAVGAGVPGGARSMVMTPVGEVVLGGPFTSAGGLPVAYVSRLLSTCPAAAAAHGLGCPSSGGANVLAAASLPWLGSVLRTRGSGLPTTAAVFVSTGVATVPQGALPLTSIFSQGISGCHVLVAPDILGLLVTTNGTAVSSLSLPTTPAVAGATFYQQMVPIEFNASFNPVAVTATNALQLTAGVF